MKHFILIILLTFIKIGIAQSSSDTTFLIHSFNSCTIFKNEIIAIVVKESDIISYHKSNARLGLISNIKLDSTYSRIKVKTRQLDSLALYIKNLQTLKSVNDTCKRSYDYGSTIIIHSKDINFSFQETTCNKANLVGIKKLLGI
jgi:hypothetical protein